MKNKCIRHNQFSGLSDEERFWEKVNKKSDDECWEWLGSLLYKWQYGVFCVGGGSTLAHRYSWKLHFGEIPPGMLVCHKCDNPPCVNPKHLFLGTGTDNMIDMVNKGRQAPVSEDKNPNAKLSREDVIQIKTLHSSGNLSGAELARKFGVKPETVYHILNGMIWKNVEVRSED